MNGVAATLAERARELARDEPAQGARDLVECIAFDLATEIYAIEIRHVREVHPLKALTPIPCTPNFVLGLINLRGQLVPVLEMKRLLGLPDRGMTNATRVIIIHDAAMEFGIVADAIVGARAFDSSVIQPPPPTFAGLQTEFLRGVTRDRITVLDAPRILAHRAILVNEEVAP